jgi:hypothetical protein
MVFLEKVIASPSIKELENLLLYSVRLTATPYPEPVE